MIPTVFALLCFFGVIFFLIVLAIRWKKLVAKQKFILVFVLIAFTFLGFNDMAIANRKKETLRHWKLPVVEVEVYFH